MAAPSFGRVLVAWVALGALVVLAGGCAGPNATSERPVASLPPQAPAFLSLTNLDSFHETPGVGPGEVVLTSPEISTGFPWDDLVVSWNAQTPRGAGLNLEVRAIYRQHRTKFYTWGWWAEDTADRPRRSVNDQKDADGDVETDTLVLREPADRFQARLTLAADPSGARPVVRFLGFSFVNRNGSLPYVRAHPAGPPAALLTVPERSQRSYPGGQDWCSPTSVSMVLAYWADVLRRPELKMDVPEVAAGVFDPSWPGTGNWAFNVAFAGSLPGLRACVTRLAGESDLQTLLRARVAPILSVSLDLLNGKSQDQGSGHLVVCLGFTADGDWVINDPWARLDAGETVRRVIPRKHALRAWQHSRQTVYLIYPETWPLPSARFGRW